MSSVSLYYKFVALKPFASNFLERFGSTIQGPASFGQLFVFVNRKVHPCIVYECFCSIVTELRSCNRDCMSPTPKLVFTIWPFIEKFECLWYNILLNSMEQKVNPFCFS